MVSHHELWEKLKELSKNIEVKLLHELPPSALDSDNRIVDPGDLINFMHHPVIFLGRVQEPYVSNLGVQSGGTLGQMPEHRWFNYYLSDQGPVRFDDQWPFQLIQRLHDTEG